MAGYELTLDDARRELGLKIPVRVSLEPNPERMAGSLAKYLGVISGSHRVLIGVGKQRVPRVGSWVTLPGRGNGSLWHELQHAEQCEAHFGGNSEKATRYYAEWFKLEMACEGYVMPDDFFAGGMARMIREEQEATGASKLFDIYESSWWEREARETQAKNACRLVGFPVSRRTRRDAQR